jgi:phosphatidylserine/phosphatidylglycerophosphate/cardiolipin synthase-like enzyme
MAFKAYYFKIFMDSILDLFEKTFEDRKLSRAERQALTQILAEQDLSAENRGFLRNRVFEFAKQHLISYSSLEVLDWLEKANKIIANQADTTPPPEVYFSPGPDCQNALLRYLGQCKKEMLICVFTISDDKIANLIQEAHKQNIDIRIITDDDKTFDKGSDIKQLHEAGIAVKMDTTPNHMHHKFAIIDENILVTGSYNWTRSAALYNHENIFVSRHSGIIQKYKDEFEKLWNEFADFG